MSATSVLVSKNCCQVPVFIGGRVTVIMDTKGRINLCVMAGDKGKTSKSMRPRKRCHLLSGFQSLPLPLQSKPRALEPKVIQSHWGRHQGQVAWPSCPHQSRTELGVLGSPNTSPHRHGCHLFCPTGALAAVPAQCSPHKEGPSAAVCPG